MDEFRMICAIGKCIRLVFLFMAPELMVLFDNFRSTATIAMIELKERRLRQSLVQEMVASW